MKILTLTVGQQATNCYLAIDDDTLQTIIIDPGDDATFISETIINQSLVPVAIILTHGHFDHCLGNLELILNFHLPVYLHQKDLSIYNRAKQTAEHFTHSHYLKNPPIKNLLTDKQILSFGNSRLQVIHTPGHTPGSVCFFSVNTTPSHSGLDPESMPINPTLFTGDTLFIDSVGDTSHSYSSKLDLQKSINLLKKLPPTTQIYPGHGESGFLKEVLG